jgi:outer membrane protein OmpA-like peptidoglycan-associated protein
MISRSADLRAKGGFRALLFAAAPLLWLGLAVVPASAQGKTATSDVTVDLGVLNSLGNSGSSAAHRVHLHPPHHDHKSAKRSGKRKSGHSHRQTARKHDHSERAAHAKSDRRHDESALERPEGVQKHAETGHRRHETKLRRAEIEPKTDLEPATKPHAPPTRVTVTPAPPIPDLRKQVLAPAPTVPPPPTTAATISPPPKPAPVAAASPPPTQPPAARPRPAMAKPAAVETPHGTSGARVAAEVAFATGTADLSPEARSALDGVAKSLASDSERRLQLVAYATGADDEANQARRLSLSRALNVRAYLIDHGVRNTRMDVRALGNRPDDGKPADRVDIMFVDK